MSGFRVAVGVLVLLAAGGCEDATGVEIIIRVGETPTKQVELFVGEDLCPDTECTPTWTTAHGYPLNAPAAYTHPRARALTADVKDGTASFILLPEPGHESKSVNIVGVVGYDGTGFDHDNITGAYVLQSTFDARGPRRYDETLLATNGRGGENFNMTGLFVDVWSQPAPIAGSADDEPERCVAFSSSANGQREDIAIVPEDDHDCDDLIAESKCYAQTPAPAADTHCIDFEAPTNRCIFGVQTCDETTGANSVCNGTRYPTDTDQRISCFPTDACTHMPNCAASPDTCRNDILALTKPITTCNVVSDGEATNLFCPNDVEVDVPLGTTAFTASSCLGVTMAALNGSVLGPFGTSVSLSGNAAITVTLNASATLCRLQFTVMGSAQSTNVNKVVVRVDLTNGYALWMPIQLHYQSLSGAETCTTNPTHCDPPATDLSLRSCLTGGP
ncbi:MAG TPA: hypothetical protein VGM90_21200 [Kofleriaceae bacterium]